MLKFPEDELFFKEAYVSRQRIDLFSVWTKEKWQIRAEISV